MKKKQYYPYLIFFSIVDSSSLYHLSTSPSLTSLLANLAVLVDQLKLNRLFSYRYTDDDNTTTSDCIVVCLHSREEKKSPLIACGGGRCDLIPLVSASH
ncbi:hypothetical protein Bca101_018695 [Brassica carinata]